MDEKTATKALPTLIGGALLSYSIISRLFIEENRTTFLISVICSLIISTAITYLIFWRKKTISQAQPGSDGCYSGSLSVCDGLPSGFEVIYKNAAKHPEISQSPQKLNTVIDFGNGKVLLTNLETSAVSIISSSQLAVYISNPTKHVQVFCGDWETKPD